MGKLLKLLDWVPLPQAAKHLSVVLNEEVSEADMLRLALDGRLQLSVNFVNHAFAIAGEVVPLASARTVPSVASFTGEPSEVVLGFDMPDGQHILQFGDQVREIVGIWDLPLIASERLDIEHRYQNLTGGPEVTGVGINGAFVRSIDAGGTYYQLMEHFQENEHFPKERLKKPWHNRENFYPAGGLPADATLVMRTSVLAEFQGRLAGSQGSAPETVPTRQLRTLLTIIAALCGKAGIDYKARGAAPVIASATEEIGTPVTDDTIRAVLREIPDALLSRSR